MALNKVMLIGNLGKDPELRTTPNGKQVASFSVACNETWVDKTGQKQEKVEWVNVIVWDKLAENCGKYLSKGRPAYVEGKLQTRSWDDKEGVKRYTTEVLAHTVQFLGSKEGGGGARPPHPADQAGAAAPANDPMSGPDGDIPF